MDIVQTGQVRAGPVGQVLGDPAVAAAQIQDTPAGAHVRRFNEGVELGQVGEPMLAQIEAKSTLAKEGVDRAGRHLGVKAFVKLAHVSQFLPPEGRPGRQQAGHNQAQADP